MQSARRSG